MTNEDMNYYNEHDSRTAEWLRELIRQRHIPAGEVDERSIADVAPGDLSGFTQCHFFAGIGGWSYALRLAGWPEDRPVWTGSCPCQPFSCAGKGGGVDDERHLWPAFRWLISQCRPTTVFGEQVASRDGREWFAGVRADLEAMGYVAGGGDLCSAGVGAPHIRQRLYWVAYSENDRQRTGRGLSSEARSRNESGTRASGRGETVRMADAEGTEQQRYYAEERRTMGLCGSNGMGNANEQGLEGHVRSIEERDQEGREDKIRYGVEARGFAHWDNYELAWRRNPKSGDPEPCRIESGSFPLAHGVPARVGRLRGYGNAITPQLAARFIEAAAASIEG